MNHIPFDGRARTWARPLLSMILWGVLAQGAAAQTLPGDLTQLPIEELMAIDLVYGASRHQQKITEAPSFVSVVTAQDIRRYGYRTLADILRGAHGFYTTYDRNYTYLGVRGFSRPSDYNSRFLLLVDGHRINDNFYGGAYIGTESILDVDLIDRVEIIRGPSSSLYGTSAFFAVINVITFAPQDTPRLQVSGLGASYGTPAGRMNVAKTFSSGTSIQASLSAYKSAGQTLFYPEYDDPQFNNGVSEDSDYDNAYQFFSTAAFKNLTVRLAYNSREKGIPTGAFDTPINDPDAKTIDSRGYLDLTYERPLSTKADLSARVSYDRSYYRGDYPYYSPYPTTLLYREHAWGEWFGAESKFTLRPTAKQTLTSGLEFRGNLKQRQRWQNVYPGPVDFDDQVHSNESGLYVQDEIAISDRLALNLGVRHDHYETFGGSTNPRAAIILFPADQTTLKLLYGSAFRAPTVYELYYGSHANPDLRPESIATYEIVLEQYAHGNLRLSGSAYLYRISDLVSVNTSSSLFENLDHVSAQGLEIEMEKRFRSGFRLRGSSTLQEARDDVNDLPLTNSPRFLAKFSGEIPIRSERLMAGVEVQYTGRRLTLDGNHASDFAVANLNVLSRQLVKGLDLSVGVYNLFDTTYADPGSEHHLQDTIEQDGRNFRIKLTWGF